MLQTWSLDLVINQFLLKLFKTTDIEIVKYCQNIFRFELPVFGYKQIKNEILASYSSVDNSFCRHILIHGWPLCFCWYTLTDTVSFVMFVCLFLYSLLSDLCWIKLFKIINFQTHLVTQRSSGDDKLMRMRVKGKMSSFKSGADDQIMFTNTAAACSSIRIDRTQGIASI